MNATVPVKRRSVVRVIAGGIGTLVGGLTFAESVRGEYVVHSWNGQGLSVCENELVACFDGGQERVGPTRRGE